MKLSLRTRLLGSFLVVIVTCGAVSTVVGVRMIGEGLISQAQDKVRLDLNSARGGYQEAISDLRDAVRHTAIRFFIRSAMQAGDLRQLAGELEKIRVNESLDVLTLTDNTGKVLLRTRNPKEMGDSQAANPIVMKVLSEKQVVASTEIVSREELLKEAPALAALAHIVFIPTPKAKPTDRTEETSGMMMKAAAPIIGEGGELLGVLYGGKLLNQNNSIVDKIKDTVYQGEIYKGREMGTATIFQGGLRISTNVQTKEGIRAIGTRVSEEVNRRVLVEGKGWVERAFVVTDWYVTAYEPIKDVSGKIIGILYVGMLEQKFVEMKRKTLWTFIVISLGGVALSVIICYALSKTLTGPVNTLVHAANRLADGDLKQRVQPCGSTEEIGLLGSAFNLMAGSIEERDEQLRQRAQEEIMKAERLAMVGQLAAGVAHEINNPLGGILLFSRLLLRKAPAEGPERENLERIAREAERCQNIVQGLLDFARQREPRPEFVNINNVVDKTVSFLANQALFHNIKIVKQFQTNVPDVYVDASQMQQVFVNIIMNAAEAMDGNGTLTITTSRTRLDRDNGVELSFADTGCGISEDDIGRLFEPFFTTKEVGRGTGLGLSISHGIVRKHGGTLSEVRAHVCRSRSDYGHGTKARNGGCGCCCR
ncbi:MAG: cache domain-containing protein [Planctomycetes bacterium]|nr:cache domain-containing protein [Planctomycetota bacterium]